MQCRAPQRYALESEDVEWTLTGTSDCRTDSGRTAGWLFCRPLHWRQFLSCLLSNAGPQLRRFGYRLGQLVSVTHFQTRLGTRAWPGFRRLAWSNGSGYESVQALM